MSARRRSVRSGAESVDVEIGADGTVRIGDTLVRVEGAGPGMWRVTGADGRTWRVHAAPTQAGVWTHVDGLVFLLEVGRTGREGVRLPPSAGDHDLSAPMPATVLSIATSVGAAAEAGDVLLLLEAMKMELPIRAPRAGMVSAIHCREGEIVQPGVPLVELT